MRAHRTARAVVESVTGTKGVLVALVLGVLVGGLLPASEHPLAAHGFQFLSKGFIALIKGIIVPIVFSTIVTGIAQTGDLRSVGRIGFKSLVYFEVVTTLALVLGLGVANWLRPGDGLPLHMTEPSAALAPMKSGWDIALHALPSNVMKHAAEADILPLVVFATLFSIALIQAKSTVVLSFFEGAAHVMFKYTALIMKLTPLGVFGAMASNVSHMAGGGPGTSGAKGWPAIAVLMRQYSLLVISLYLALFLLVVFVFIPVMLACRIPVVPFFRAVREPATIAFSTASSESALPKLLENIERFGVPRRVASFVIPTGYSFNLDGSTLYLVLASLTIAQAAKIDLPLSTQIAMMVTFMLTSKGVAGVPRATLVIIAGTCGSFGIPGEAGIATILAVDEVMDMARSALNLTGNGLAACVIARWEGVFQASTAPENDTGRAG